MFHEDVRVESWILSSLIRQQTQNAKLKDWRRVATRYDRCAHTFMSATHIAASFIFYLKE